MLHVSNGYALSSLIAANVFTIYGFVFLGWDITTIIVAYWFENLIVLLFSLLKLKKIERSSNTAVQNKDSTFFIIFFGGFSLVHGLVLFAIFYFSGYQNLGINVSDLSIIIGTLLASHGISYVTNFLLSKEYEKFDASFNAIFTPFKRVIFTHVMVIVFLPDVINSLASAGETATFVDLLPAILLLTFKTTFDAYFHISEHRKPGEKGLFYKFIEVNLNLRKKIAPYTVGTVFEKVFNSELTDQHNSFRDTGGSSRTETVTSANGSVKTTTTTVWTSQSDL